MKRYFITATGTDVGKTYVTTFLCEALRQDGKSVKALKPVVTGFDNCADSDTHRLLRACGESISLGAVEHTSPFRYVAPLSPDLAAECEHKPAPTLTELVQHSAPQACNHDYLLVEGIGGVMVPLNNQHTVRDWMEALNYPVLLVTGTYLGTLSHTLTALCALRTTPYALLVNQSEKGAAPEETMQSLKPFVPASLPMYGIGRNRPQDIAHFIQAIHGF